MKARIDSGNRKRQGKNLDKAGNNLEAFNARVRRRWRQLGDEQLEHVAGRREALSRELQRTYGLSPRDAETEIDDFEAGGLADAARDSGRGPTERSREFGAGNDQGGTTHHDRHRLH